MKNKRGFELDLIGWMIAGLAVLVIIFIAIGILGGKGNSAIDFIKNIFSNK